MKRTYRVILFAVLLPIVGYLIFISSAGQHGLRWLVQGWLQQRLAARVEIERLAGSLPGELEMRGLSISLETSPIPILGVDYLILHCNWSSLLGSGPFFSLLEMKGLRLQFQGRQQVREGWEWVHRLEERESAAGSEPGRWLPAAFLLEEIQLLYAGSGDTLLVHGPSLRFEEMGMREGAAVRFELAGEHFFVDRNHRQVGPISLRGRFLVNRGSVRIEDFSAAAADLEIQLRGEGSGGAGFALQLDGEGDLQALAPLLFPRNELEGRGGLHVELEGGAAGLRAEGAVRLERLRTAHLALDSLDARFTHADGRLELDSLRVDIGSGRLVGRGGMDLRAGNHPWDLNVAVQEADLARLFPSLRLGGRAHGQLEARGRWSDTPFLAADLELQGRGLTFDAHPLGPFTLKMHYDSSRVEIDLQSDLGTLELQGELDPEGNHALTGRLSVSALEKQEGFLGFSGWQGHLQAQVESRGDLQASQLRAAIRGSGMAWESFWLGDLEAELQIDSTGLFRLGLDAPGPRLRLEVGGSLDSGGVAEGRLELGEVPISAFFHPEHRSLWRGYLGASLSFSGELQNPELLGKVRLRELSCGGQSFGDARGALSLADRQVRFQAQTPDSSVVLSGAVEWEAGLPFSLRGRVQSADLAPFLYLAGRRELGYAGRLSGRLRAEGHLRQIEQIRVAMDIDSLQLRSGQRTLELTRPTHVRIEEGVTIVRDLRISGSEGSLRVDGRAERLGPLDLQVDLEDLQLSFLSPFLGAGRKLHGSIDAHFHLTGQAQAPVMAGRVRGESLRYGARVLGDFQAVFSYSNRLLRLEPLSLDLHRGRLHGWATWPLELDLAEVGGIPADGEYELQLFAEGVELGGALGLPAGIELSADGSLHLRGPVREPGRITGSMQLPHLQLRTPLAVLVNAEPVDLRLEPGKWTLAPLQLQLLSSAEGGVEMGAVQVGGSLVRQGASALRIRVRDLVLSPLARQIPEIEQLDGRLDLALDIGGTWNRLEPRGVLSIRSGRVQIPGMKTQLAFAHGQVDIQPGVARFSGFEGEHGKGGWSLPGTVHLDGIRPDSLDLELALVGMDLRFSENSTLTVNGRLRWTGTTAASQLQGRLQIPRGKIVRIMDVASSMRGESTPLPPPSPFLDRVALQAEIDVQQVGLDATFAKGKLRGNLELRGSAARPIVSGRIVGADAYLLYLDRRFEMERAALLLVNPEPAPSLFSLFQHPATLDPQIDIAAHTSIEANDGNEYRIDLGLNGPLSDLQFEMISDPPQSRVQILSLLNFGDLDVPMLDSGGLLLDRAATLSTRYLLQVPRSHFQRVLDLERVEIDANLFKPTRLGRSRLILSKKLNQRTEVTYSTTVGHAAEGRVKVNYDLAKYLFLEVERDALGESGADLKLRLKFR